jgi:hypothetical protein
MVAKQVNKVCKLTMVVLEELQDLLEPQDKLETLGTGKLVMVAEEQVDQQLLGILLLIG